MSRGASRVGPKREEGRTAKVQGATSSRRGLGAKFSAYLSHHKVSLLTSYRRLLASPLQSFLTALVVAIALTLPALLLLALGNLQALGSHWDASPSMTLFLNPQVKENAVEGLLSEMRADKRIESLRYVSSAEALREFQALSGFGDVLEALSENPLPPSIEIKPGAQLASQASQQALVDEYRANPLIERVLFDMAWVQRFLALMALAEKVVFILAALLCLGALLAIGNTVRLVIENRKEEIVVIKLVGGTDGFVRRPLLYTGGLYGAAGALLCCLLVSLVLGLLQGPMKQLIALYQSDFQMQGLSLAQVLWILAIGTTLGWLGALLAVGRHLAHIEPK